MEMVRNFFLKRNHTEVELENMDIGDYSDWEMIDGKHYCPDCYEVEVIDGVYNVKAK